MILDRNYSERVIILFRQIRSSLTDEYKEKVDLLVCQLQNSACDTVLMNSVILFLKKHFTDEEIKLKKEDFFLENMDDRQTELKITVKELIEIFDEILVLDNTLRTAKARGVRR